LAEYLSGYGFSPSQGWEVVPAFAEITAGYLSCLRTGNLKTKGDLASVLDPLDYLALYDGLPILTDGTVQLAVAEFHGGLLHPEGKAGFANVWRMTLYLAGPGRAVRDTVESLLEWRQLPDGTRSDLESALTWWSFKRQRYKRSPTPVRGLSGVRQQFEKGYARGLAERG
jgi:hypothetical protein